jgi:hypothetical protein
MSIAVACPTCVRTGQVPDTYAGRRVRCPQCKTFFTAAGSPAPSRPCAGRSGLESVPAASRFPGEPEHDSSVPRSGGLLDAEPAMLAPGPVFRRDSAVAVAAVRRLP